jgi:hypothetical protein
MVALAEQISWSSVSESRTDQTVPSFRIRCYSGRTQETEENKELSWPLLQEEQQEIDIGDDVIGLFSKFLHAYASDTTQIENPRAITVFLLDRLMEAPSKMINTLLDLLRAKSAPQVILETSLEAYRKTNYDRYLTVATSLLEGFGKDAWPTLRNLSKSTYPECDLFVRLIANCPDVPASERAAALIDIAKHPDKDVRNQIPEVLCVFGNEEQGRILQVLMNDADPDIREEAHEYFSLLQNRST